MKGQFKVILKKLILKEKLFQFFKDDEVLQSDIETIFDNGRFNYYESDMEWFFNKYIYSKIDFFDEDDIDFSSTFTDNFGLFVEDSISELKDYLF